MSLKSVMNSLSEDDDESTRVKMSVFQFDPHPVFSICTFSPEIVIPMTCEKWYLTEKRSGSLTALADRENTKGTDDDARKIWNGNVKWAGRRQDCPELWANSRNRS